MEKNLQSASAPKSAETLAAKWITALIAIACVAVIGFQISRVLNHRAQLWKDEETDTANLTSSLIEHAELTMRTADALLTATVFGLEHDVYNDGNLPKLQAWFADELRHSSQFTTFMVIGPDGRIRIGAKAGDSRLDLSDREYFIHHRAHDDREVHIGGPLRGRLTGEWFIPVTRRFDRPDGSFGGVVVASLNPKFFLDAYRKLDVGKNGAIMLASLDRTLLVRRPFVEADVGRRLQGAIFERQKSGVTGSVDMISPIDGVRRILSYGIGANYPILLTVAKDATETLAPWRHDTTQIFLETTSMVGLLMLLGAIIWNVARRLADKATTLREANDRFDTAIKTMSHGLCLFDSDQKLVLANSRFREIYRLDEGVVARGVLFADLLRMHAERGDQVVVSEEGDGSPYKCVLGSGNIISIRRSETPSGGWVSIHEDVTERENAAAALMASKNAAEAANRAKSDFLAIMSHEIRTPMAGMMGMIHLFAETDLNAEQRQLAETAQDSARGLLKVVNDILDLSKLEAGQVTPEVTDFGLESVIGSVTALLAPRAAERGLELTAAIDPEMPGNLMGDPSRISQIMLNLVGNAIKFTEAGSVSVTASHRMLPGDGVELRIEVVDTGMGLSASSLATLFDPFMQADTSISRKYGGTGLGLAICKRLSATMGGSIGVESEPGRGSKFWFTAACRIGDESPEVPAPALVPTIGNDAGTVAILVAEDNHVLQTLISKLLLRAGYRPDVVSNGREAVEALGHRSYGLVLMDMQMPEMDGIEATKTIRATGGPARDVPIIALTANATVGQREICLAAGMNGFLTKPIQPQDLYDAVMRWGITARDDPAREAEVVS